NRTGNRTAHAEIVAFSRAGGKIDFERKDLILISSLEPCVMCTGAAMEAGVDTIIYGLHAPADNGSSRVTPPQSPESQMPRIIGPILPEESRRLFQQWITVNAHARGSDFVKQLLQST